MSRLAPGSLGVRVGTGEASKRAGDVRTPNRPPRSQARPEAPGVGVVPSLPSALRPQQDTLVLGDGQEGGLRAPELV